MFIVAMLHWHYSFSQFDDCGKKNSKKHDFLNLSFSVPSWNGTQNRWLLWSLIHGVKKKKKKQSLPSITKALSPNIRGISHPALAASILSLPPSPLHLFQAHSVDVAKITRATFGFPQQPGHCSRRGELNGCQLLSISGQVFLLPFHQRSVGVVVSFPVLEQKYHSGRKI